jgi:hypothetical protein
MTSATTTPIDAHCALDMPRTFASICWGDVLPASLERRLKSDVGLRMAFMAGCMYCCIVWTELWVVSGGLVAAVEGGSRWCHAALVDEELAELEADS